MTRQQILVKASMQMRDDAESLKALNALGMTWHLEARGLTTKPSYDERLQLSAALLVMAQPSAV